LRDGMNLVAKEFVAAQDHENPGVLVLSRFAGAAAECTAALLVNPHDPESVATTIAQALAMPLEERRERHEALYRVIAKNDIRSWGENFLAALTEQPASPLAQQWPHMRALASGDLTLPDGGLIAGDGGY
jgi:trehalose 6-phosphate synthase